MGKTAFSGPVYGAKQTLLQRSMDSISTGVVAEIRVPVGEDWYVSELSIYRQSTGSTAYGVALIDDSTVVSSANLTSSAAALSTTTVIAADGGEYEGARIASGSIVQLLCNSTGLHTVVTLRGYPRWVSSSKAE